MLHSRLIQFVFFNLLYEHSSEHIHKMCFVSSNEQITRVLHIQGEFVFIASTTEKEFCHLCLQKPFQTNYIEQRKLIKSTFYCRISREICTF